MLNLIMRDSLNIFIKPTRKLLSISYIPQLFCMIFMKFIKFAIFLRNMIYHQPKKELLSHNNPKKPISINYFLLFLPKTKYMLVKVNAYKIYSKKPFLLLITQNI